VEELKGGKKAKNESGLNLEVHAPVARKLFIHLVRICSYEAS